MAEPIRWGLISAGVISRSFAKNLVRCESGRLAAVAARDGDKARAFAAGFEGCRGVEGYEALLADPEIDAVYIGTIHPEHERWAVAAAEAGKHILCEKPLAMDAASAGRIARAARDAGVFCMEAFMYRVHPLTLAMAQLVRDGAVGQVRAIETSMGFPGNAESTPRLFQPELGGGAILDIGCYAATAARAFAGAGVGEPFEHPVEVQGTGVLGEAGADVTASAVLRFPSGAIAKIGCSIAAPLPGRVMVSGAEGWMELRDPWFGTGTQGGSREIVAHRNDGTTRNLTVDEPRWLYEPEIDHVADCLAKGLTESPLVSLDDTLSNMRVLDAWRAACGYPPAE